MPARLQLDAALRVIRLCGLEELATAAPGSTDGDTLQRQEKEAAQIDKMFAFSFEDHDPVA